MKSTQAQMLFRALRKRWMTWQQVLYLGISTCPWKRCSESIHLLNPGETLQRRINSRGLVEVRVVRVRNCA